MTRSLLSEQEAEVAQARRDLGQTDREISATAGIRPTQFRGIESVPLAAAVSEVVVRIAALQRHFRTYGNGPPPESATGDFKAIECRDAVLAWDGDTPRPAADWPQADFIVGNPPFIGNSKMRRALGDRYVEGLRTAYPNMPGTVDFPFPDATEAQKEHIRAIAEQLDTHRKTKQASFPKLTLTAMYGVLEKSRAGEPLSAKERKIAEQAELQELQRLHDELDAAVADAYGWLSIWMSRKCLGGYWS